MIFYSEDTNIFYIGKVFNISYKINACKLGLMPYAYTHLYVIIKNITSNLSYRQECRGCS